MSERKAEYYAKHLETLVEPEVQPIGLPTLLARMVTEFQVGLGSQTPETHEILVRTFTADLLSAAQPLLTEYLNKITNPPKFVVKQQQDEASLPMMVRAVLAAERVAAKEPADPVKALLLEYQQYAENLPVWQHALSFPEWRKGLGAK